MSRRSEGKEMNRLEAERIVRRLAELPTLPAIIARILEVLNDERSSAKDLEKVISFDQSIASKVLRIANSAYYGFPQEISTIHRAIVILGFQTVKGLALGSSIFETFFRQGEDSCFDRTAYWLHSIACSRCAMTLGKQVGGVDPEEAFLAGLIHDIGMVVMDQVLHENYGQFLKRAVDCEGPLSRLERDTCGFDHADVGAWLAERWKFPPSLSNSIRNHHSVLESDESLRRLVAVIHLADFCSNEAGLSVTEGNDGCEVQEEVLEMTGVSRENLTDLSDHIREERDQIEAFFRAMVV